MTNSNAHVPSRPFGTRLKSSVPKGRALRTRFARSAQWVYKACLYSLLGLLFTQPAAAATPTPPGACQPLPPPNARFGINVAREDGKEITDYDVAAIDAGWYLDYTWHEQPAHPNGMTYLPMLRRWQPEAAWQAKLAATLAAHPGELWILGNEPDHREQDDRTPEEYAHFYHTAYTFIKGHDPTSRIAIAAVTQPTPLRLHYLDLVLHAYQQHYGTALPVDMWNVHGYILPETTDWGVGLPPGMDAFADEGQSYTLDEHDDLTRFAAQLRAMRRWMAARGYRDKPLMLSEFGILLPPDYGYTNERVIAFMQQSFTWLQQATDAQIGYRADGGRLVQQWAWFSLNYYAYDPETGEGHNGHLFDHGSGHLTPVGRAFAAYIKALATPAPAPTLVDATVTPATVPAGGAHPLTLHLRVANPGATPLTGLTLAIGWNEQTAPTTVQIQRTIAPHCQTIIPLTITWLPPPLAVGRHAIALAVTATHTNPPARPVQPVTVTIQVE